MTGLMAINLFSFTATVYKGELNTSLIFTTLQKLHGYFFNQIY